MLARGTPAELARTTAERMQRLLLSGYGTRSGRYRREWKRYCSQIRRACTHRWRLTIRIPQTQN